MKILLTGVTGFMGKNVLSALLDSNFKVIAPVRAQSWEKVNSTDKNLFSVKGDFWEDSILHAYKEIAPEIIIHLAALRGEGLGNFDEYHRINIAGTEKLVNYALENDIKLFIYCSTVGVYGTIPAILPAGLDSVPKPDNNYHFSKYQAEKIVTEKLKDKIPFIILRPTITYGPGDNGFLIRLVNLVKHKKFPLNWRPVNIHLLNIETFVSLILELVTNSITVNHCLVVADRSPVLLSELVNVIYNHYYSANYPGYLKIPGIFYDLMKASAVLLKMSKLETSLRLVSESWYYDTAALLNAYPIELTDTLPSICSYLNIGYFE
jgi:nucleoside-diphosphate-sugar epimerase